MKPGAKRAFVAVVAAPAGAAVCTVAFAATVTQRYAVQRDLRFCPLGSARP